MTIISNSHRFIFVHLHKCGGTSVETAYQPHAAWNDLVLGSTKEGEVLQSIYKQLHGLHKHSSAKDIRAVVGDVWEAYETIALVRHPMRIYESYYRWIHKIVANFCDKKNIGFDEVLDYVDRTGERRAFLKFGATGPFLKARNFDDFVLRLIRKRSSLPLAQYLSDGEGRLIVDRWYRIEEMDGFWADLSDRIGVAVVPRHDNQGSAVEIPPWGSEAERRVREMHTIDFEMFGYE